MSLASSSSLIERVAALALGFYLALQAMLANEFLASYAKIPFPILIVTGLPVLFLWMLTGHYGRFARSGITLVYMALLGWWWLCTLIGSLKGEYMVMLQYGLRFHLVAFVFCGIASNFGLLRSVLNGYATGFIGALVLCAKFGQIDEAGRLGIPGTSLENPNDLALTLLIGLSILCMFAFDANLVKRFVWFICFGATLFFVLKTGSRANLLTLGAMMIVIVVASNSRTRLFFLASTLLLSCVALIAIPKSTLVRLTTFFSFSEADYLANQQVVNAATSTLARKELQIRAFMLAVRHPIFGVGPHMFLYALDDYMRVQENTQKGSWQYSHNTYLDIAAETGFPGLIMYCITMFWCIRKNYRGYKRAQREPALANFLGVSISLLLATIAFAFGTLFCSIPYWGIYCYLVGLTAAGHLVLKDYDQRRAIAARVPVRSKHPDEKRPTMSLR